MERRTDLISRPRSVVSGERQADRSATLKYTLVEDFGLPSGSVNARGTRRHSIGTPGDLVSGVEFTGAAAHQTGHPTRIRGGEIETIDPGSPADRSGLNPGDVVTSVNGRLIRDVVDYQFYSATALVTLEVHSGSGDHTSIQILKEAGQSLGITFTQPTFSPIRECNNHCPFCFIDQLPGEMRGSLYIRDDDYRYSFLFGNFVTLTNLNESDWSRLAEQKLSPLYVSVHATDPDLRRLLLGNEKAPDVVAQLERLFASGIKIHAQVVVCPGLNDGSALQRTVDDLIAMYPNVLSIGVVPVGLTRTPDEILSGPGASCSRILPSARDLDLRTVNPAEARAIVEQVRSWQLQQRAKNGLSLVYASDELYLRAGMKVPGARTYDRYPQYENGIGMVRDLLDDWSRTRRRLMSSSPIGRAASRTATVICGEMIAPILAPMVDEWSAITGVRSELAPLANAFFGERVTVSGLLTGRDVLGNQRKYHGNVVILPGVMLDKTGSKLLDGFLPAELETQLGKPVRFASTMSQLTSVFRDLEVVGPQAA